MKLSAAYILLAQKIQESSTAMCHEDIRTRLQDCLRDAFTGTGNWCYIVAVFGDDKSGDVVYSCNSDLKKAAYTMAPGLTKIDVTAAVDVQPLTTYEVESSEVLEAGRRNSARDQKQLQAIHDSAMGLGAVCVAPKESAGQRGAGRGTGDSTGDTASTREAPGSGNLPAGRESANESVGGGQSASLIPRTTGQIDSIQLFESAATMEFIPLVEAKSSYQIKLIAPGKGSSAFYPAEVLKRDGPKVFKEGTHVYLNHPTSVEEAQRPEGDVRNLAGVLATTAQYIESHKNGPGLYAEMKVFADHAQTIEEKSSHVGMSIRASGLREGNKLQDGVPVLKELISAESVDVVTRAGAGGMILNESATGPQTTEKGADDMDAAELKKLTESLAAQNVVNQKLLERALRGDAREAAAKLLVALTLPESAKTRVIEASLRDIPKTEAGELDTVKFAEIVNREAKAEGAYVAELTGSGRVTGMGAGGGPVETDPAKVAEAEKRTHDAGVLMNRRAKDVFSAFGLSEAGAKAIAKEYGEEAA